MAEIVHGAASVETQTIYGPDTSIAYFWTCIVVFALVGIGQMIKACVGESAVKKVASTKSADVREATNGSYLFSGLLLLAALITTTYSIFVFYNADTTAVDTGYTFWIAGGIANVLLMLVYLLKPMYLLRGPTAGPTKLTSGIGAWTLFAWAVVPYIMWNVLFSVLFYVGPTAGAAVLIIILVLTVLVFGTIVYYAVMMSQEPSGPWVIAVGILTILFNIAYGIIVLLAPPVASVLSFEAVGIAYLCLQAGNVFLVALADFIVDLKSFNEATSAYPSHEYNNNYYPMTSAGMYGRQLRNPVFGKNK
jgi:hypothetical protein